MMHFANEKGKHMQNINVILHAFASDISRSSSERSGYQSEDTWTHTSLWRAGGIHKSIVIPSHNKTTANDFVI